MKRIKAVIIALFAAVFILTAVFFAFNSSPIKGDSVLYTVEKGDSIRGSAEKMQKAGFIRSADFFVLLSKITHKNAIRSGRYRLHPGDGSMRILNKIETGEVVTAKVLIPEGYNLTQIADALDEVHICGKNDFLKDAKDPVFLKKIGINAPTAEGYLFPETYIIAEDSDARDVIIILKNKMVDVLKNHKYSKEKTGMSVHQLLTIASIIEKEAKVKSEQKTVASVFYNRLKINMSLQSCATVLYALNKTVPHLLLKDLEVDSPFNTYKHNGLPPTPIASPGAGAIDAAINPAKTDYKFFVSRNDGTHYFSSNYSKHLKAQNFYVNGQKNGFVDDQKK